MYTSLWRKYTSRLLNAQIIAEGNHIFVSTNIRDGGRFVHVTPSTGFSCNKPSP